MEGEMVAQTDAEKAEVLNRFFASVFTREDTTNIPPFESFKKHILVRKKNLYGIETGAKKYTTLMVNITPNEYVSASKIILITNSMI